MPTFDENFGIGETVELLRTELMILSVMGYRALSYQCRSAKLSIEIDRPLVGAEPGYGQIGGKKIAFVVSAKCRLYWEIPSVIDPIGPDIALDENGAPQTREALSAATLLEREENAPCVD